MNAEGRPWGIFVRWIRKALRKFRTRRNRFPVFESTFPALSPETVFSELELSNVAARNGVNGIPATDARQPDSGEASILRYVQKDVVEVLAGYRAHMKGLNDRISSIRGANPSAARDALAKLRAETRARETLLREELLKADQEARAAETEFQRFRKEQRLDREPQLSDSHALSWAIILVVLAVEALVNSVFFERGSALGFVGGAMTALVLAAIDVLVVWTLGRASTRVVGRRRLDASVGTIAAATTCVWVVGYNLLVGHIREQLQVNAEMAQELALTAFLASPLGLRQADSWVLVAVGVVGSAFAWVTAYRWDEPYPGYADVARRRNRLREERDQQRAQLHSFEDQARQGAWAALETIRRDALQDLRSLENTIKTKEMLSENVRLFIRDREEAAIAAIIRYRDENRISRPDSVAPPAFFDEPPSIPKLYDVAEGGAEDDNSVAEVKASLVALTEEIESLRKDLPQKTMGRDDAPVA